MPNFSQLLIALSFLFFSVEVNANTSISVSDMEDSDSTTNNTDIFFSHPAGFYDTAFTLTLKAPEEGDSIIYSVNGSNPIYKTRSFTGGNSFTVYINPDNPYGRGKTPAVVVKACIIRNDSILEYPKSQTYIFINKVIAQKFPEGNWPHTSINGQVIDYDMDADVVKDYTYSQLIKPALLSIPSLSISTDMNNLFNANKGIYVNAGRRGITWERECTAELIYPDTTTGFSINAGLRIRGGSSRDKDNPKHSFRLFFRGDYGFTKLRYPLFGEEGPDKFDKIDLRTEQNYAWNKEDEEGRHNTFVRDIFSRDMQGLMNQPYSKGRYYHLFLNGMYWGIYQTDERKDATFGNTYFGGKKSDYDVIKVTPQNFPYVNEVTDGNDLVWRKLYNLCNVGFATNPSYFRLEGKDGSGKFDRNQEVLVDIDNLIDYMLLIFYTGNFDAPTSAFWGNRMPNNYYAIFNRNNKAEGFVFIAHDSEHSMMVDPVYAGFGLYEDRVNIAEFDDWYHFDVEKFLDFNPQWIHYKLTENAEYRQRFADRAEKYFGENGIFTPDRAEAVLQKRIDQIDTAIVAESARWGDAQRSNPRTLHGDWYPEINVLLNDFLPFRTHIVKGQLKDAGLYFGIPKPAFLVNSEIINSENYSINGSETITISKNSDVVGAVYYTLDGTDPRTLGGSSSDNAEYSPSDIDITINQSTIISARTRSNGKWGPLIQLNCLTMSEDLSKLKVTEIHYHPEDKVVDRDTISGKDLEFIELKNTGNTALNISGIALDSAISYTVPANTILAPGAFYVIASDSVAFGTVYGIYPSGVYKKSLSNSGEYLLANNSEGYSLFSLEYSDAYPWPESADGEGYSLTATQTNPVGNPALVEYWKTSSSSGGTPFLDDTTYHTNSVNPIALKEISVYPNPTSDQLLIDLAKVNEEVNIYIYNQVGTCIYRDATIQQNYSLSFNDLKQNTGIYFIKLVGASWTKTEKIFYIR